MTRIAVIHKDRCNPIGCGNCLCIRVCPINRAGKECIVKGDDNKPRIDEEICTGCGICPKKCPYEAISIINLPEALKENPTHQYGINGFRLYNLPIPKFGKVVGILGKNGIGKTTAIKILAGVLKPNFGSLEQKEIDFKQLIDFFKGTEAQLFFEKVRDKKIKISYKLQQVDLIPKQVKGKVRDLLKKVDERNKLNDIIEKLELKEILDNHINEISGGELQRVAIAAAVLKDANLYIFDEPTSYLDIKQRIKVSKFIKSLANEKTAVMVVEHDLIILDYMADLVHIMYGEEGCYGVVGLPKATRTAINVYLDGYLKEENIRFRPYKIKFEEKPPVKTISSNLLISWNNIQKKLGKFELEAKESSLYKNEVIGVLGENGIGKTSFVKILAEVIKADKGNVSEKVKVSYKPQYLENSDELVVNILKDAIQRYTNQIINPLGIKPLLTKKLNELSGGELQRVATARCLSQDTHLFLLDEPSAYLDVEQRLLVSKVIKDISEEKGNSILVVDHDLMFIDYLSQKLLVFTGKPALNGRVNGPFDMEEGMNLFLEDMGITYRRDQESRRPRANKEDSVKDREQKKNRKYYYS